MVCFCICTGDNCLGDNWGKGRFPAGKFGFHCLFRGKPKGIQICLLFYELYEKFVLFKEPKLLDVHKSTLTIGRKCV